MEHLAKKYGQAAVSTFGRPGNPLDIAGRKVGITFNSNRKIFPTMNCHRAVEWCSTMYPTLTNSFMEDLFHSYFTEAKNINSTDVILASASKVNLDTSELRRILDSTDEYKQAVEDKVRHAKSNLKVNGVPYFIVHSTSGRSTPIAISGAQPPHVLAEVLGQASSS